MAFLSVQSLNASLSEVRCFCVCSSANSTESVIAEGFLRKTKSSSALDSSSKHGEVEEEGKID
jgi:hypothetical protein